MNTKRMMVLVLPLLAVAALAAPPNGDASRGPSGLLYAPTNADNPAFRAAVAAILGEPVDYFDARVMTPTVDLLLEYRAVFTWVNFAYADAFGMGDVLADYADAGGSVILGRWCAPGSHANALYGRVMDEYCPIEVDENPCGSSSYDPTTGGPVHEGVETYSAGAIDHIVYVEPHAVIDGRYLNGCISVVYHNRCKPLVFYSAGNAGMTFGETGDWPLLVANMVTYVPPPMIGACCNELTGECVDDVMPDQCCGAVERYGPAQTCAELDPPCEETACDGLLYAPSEPDNEAWRAQVALLLGARCDYLDVRYTTPTLAELAEYCCVFTWANYAYADEIAFGDVLADYVDGGGRVILGQWSYLGLTGGPSGGGGRIVGPEYCPVTVVAYSAAAYTGGGTDCAYTMIPVAGWSSNYVDLCNLREGAVSDGVTTTGGPALAWRPDRAVYYSPGNTGADYTNGDTAELVANMYLCSDVLLGDLNCDGQVNFGDINPFVLALTNPEGYAEAYPDCDRMLADCNGDGVVGFGDINPFVVLLAGG